MSTLTEETSKNGCLQGGENGRLRMQEKSLFYCTYPFAFLNSVPHTCITYSNIQLKNYFLKINHRQRGVSKTNNYKSHRSVLITVLCQGTLWFQNTLLSRPPTSQKGVCCQHPRVIIRHYSMTK